MGRQRMEVKTLVLTKEREYAEASVRPYRA